MVRGFEVPNIPPALVELLFTVPQDEALADGRLVAAPEELRREARIVWPVRLTRAAWDRHAAVTPAAERMLCDLNGRIWDLFTMFKLVAKRANSALIAFEFAGVAEEPAVKRHRLYAVIAPDEEGRPTAVFATPEEARGEAEGKAIRSYLERFDPLGDEDEDEDDLGDVLVW